MGAETDIHAALIGRLETLTTSLPIHYPGVTFDDTSGEYIRATHLRNDPVRRTYNGAERFMRMGFLRLDVFRRVDAGTYQVTADAQAEAIADHFPPDLVLTSGGETIRVKLTRIETGRKDPNGTHWMTPVVVEYRTSKA